MTDERLASIEDEFERLAGRVWLGYARELIAEVREQRTNNACLAATIKGLRAELDGQKENTPIKWYVILRRAAELLGCAMLTDVPAAIEALKQPPIYITDDMVGQWEVREVTG